MDEKQIGDMYLAAALISYGATLCRIDRDDIKRQKFCFTDKVRHIWVIDGETVAKIVTPSLEEVETRYISKTLIFPPSYPDAIRGIKAAIHSE